MATVTDILETVYKASDQASKVVDHIAESNERLGRVTNAAKAALATLVGSSVIAGVGAFAREVAAAARSFEALEARLTAVTGSAERARAVLANVALVAAPSPFTFTQLAESATLLEAFGLNAERSLPIIGRLGAVFGAGSEQIDMFTRAIGELAQGSMIDADVRASMGLTNADFEAKGIKFDNNGKLLSSANEALTALEQIVNERYGGIFDQMANTGTAKLASVGDAWERFQRILGDGVNTVVAPGLERTTRLLGALTESGVALDAVSRAAKGAEGLFGLGSDEGIARMAGSVLSIIATTPQNIRAIIGYVSDLFTTVFDNIGTAAKFAEDTFNAWVDNAGRKVDALIRLVQATTNFDAAGAQAAAADLRSPGRSVASPQFKALPNAGTYGLQSPLALADSYTSAIAQYMAKQSGAQGLPDVSNIPFLKNGGASGESGRIVEAVEKTAKNTTDLLANQRQTLGGLGSRPADFAVLDLFQRSSGFNNGAYMAGGPPRAMEISVSGDTRDGLVRFIADIARTVVETGIRSGALMATGD